MIDSVDNDILLDSDSRITGKEIAGELPSAENYIAAIVELFGRVSPTEFKLDSLESFEQVMVGVFIRKFHLMVEKQKGYGKSNISKAGMHGLLTRAQDKLERAKNIIGNPEKQLERVQDILRNLPDDANESEMAKALMALDAIVEPQEHAEESIEDTVVDLSNYGDIMYMVLEEAWGKDLESV